MKPILKDINEVKTIAGHFNISTSFNDMLPALELAIPVVVSNIGEAMYQLAEAHYNSENYNVTDQADATYLRLDVLVKSIQRVLIYDAHLRNVNYNDLETSDAGRKIVVSETQKSPFEWQLDRYDDSLMRDRNDFIDSLLSFILKEATHYAPWIVETEYKVDNIVKVGSLYYICTNDHIATDFLADIAMYWNELDKTTDIIFWEFTESEEYAMLQEIFVSDVKTFQSIINIDNSARYFFSLRTILNNIQIEEIMPRLTTEQYNALISAKLYNNFTPEQKLMLVHIQRAMVYLAHSYSIEENHINVMPRSVFQSLQSEFAARNARRPATTDDKNRIAAPLRRKGEAHLEKLDKYIETLMYKQLTTEQQATFKVVETEKKKVDTTQKYFSTL